MSRRETEREASEAKVPETAPNVIQHAAFEPGPQPRLRSVAMALSAILAGAVLLIPGIVALLIGEILLFPSLGPTAVMQAHTPNHPGARPTHIIVGHLVGLSSAYLMVGIFGLSTSPSIFAAHAVSAQRVLAAVLAICLATFIELALRTSHPPGAATTLLVALGSFKPTARDVVSIIAGVLIVAIAGEGIRRLRIMLNFRLQPAADWGLKQIVDRRTTDDAGRGEPPP